MKQFETEDYPFGGQATQPDFPSLPEVSPVGNDYVLLLGGGLMQIPALRACHREGLKVLLVDGNPQAPAAHLADAFYPIDLKDKEQILTMAQEFLANKVHQTEPIKCIKAVFTAATDFSANVAWLAQKLSVPTSGYQACLNASEKHRMRQIFSQNGIPSPGFLALEAHDRLEESAFKALAFPLVVKPVDNMGARGVSKVTNLDQLVAALELARRHSRSSVVIVEEFIDGPEYSIDSLLIDGKLFACGIALRHIFFPPWFVEMGHTMPSGLSVKNEAQMIAVFSKAVAALGIKNGVAKGDVFFGPHGPVIGEIAARLSGGYMSGWTFPAASGIDLTRQALRLALGRPCTSLEPRWHKTSVERAFVSIPGIVKQILNRPSLSLEGPLLHYFERIQVGDSVVFPRNNVEKAGNVIACSTDRQQAINAACHAAASLIVRLEPCQKSTDKFLFAKNSLVSAWQPQDALEIATIFDGFVAADPNWKNHQTPLKGELLDFNWRSPSFSLELLKNVFPAWWMDNLSHAYKQDRDLVLACFMRGGLQGLLYLVDSLGVTDNHHWRVKEVRAHVY